MSGKTRKGNRYLRRALCQSGWAATHKKDSHLAALFPRSRGPRRGEQKAIMALAHELLTIIFHVLHHGTVYKELGADHYDQQNKPKVTGKLVERLQRLGYYVTLQAAESSLPAVGATDPLPSPTALDQSSSCQHHLCGAATRANVPNALSFASMAALPA